MGRGRDDELHADALAHPAEDGVRSDCELVAAVQRGCDSGRALGCPVAFAVEAPGRAHPTVEAPFLGERNGAFDVGAPIGADDLSVPLLECMPGGVVSRGESWVDGCVGAVTPPVEVRVDELAERHRVCVCARIAFNADLLGGCRGQGRSQLGHSTNLRLSSRRSGSSESTPIRPMSQALCQAIDTLGYPARQRAPGIYRLVAALSRAADNRQRPRTRMRAVLATISARSRIESVPVACRLRSSRISWKSPERSSPVPAIEPPAAGPS